MSQNNLYLDIHILQTLPPSNVNRDDTGSPKTAQYGGVTRSRVSSQSWKKAMRDYFRTMDKEQFPVGIRSKHHIKNVAGKIAELDASLSIQECQDKAEAILKTIGVEKPTENKDANKKASNNKSDQKTKVLLFLSEKQIEALAKLAIEEVSDNKDFNKRVKESVQKDIGLDMALFGRMLAEDPTLNEDASSQVAHAISTHTVQTEFDFFTATDDASPDDTAAAGMLGTVEFTSSTLYRYANVAIHKLFKQLNTNKSITVASVGAFVEAFVKSMPTGKINTFANQTVPQLVIAVLRHDRPVNLVTAFESPVKNKDGYVEGSVKKLLQEFDNVKKFVEDADWVGTIVANSCADIVAEYDILGGDNSFDSLAHELSLALEKLLVQN